MWVQIDKTLENKCVLVALSLALGCTVDEIDHKLAQLSFTEQYYIEPIWSKLLLNNDFKLITIPAIIGKQRCTIENLLDQSKNAKIIAKCANHVVFIENHNYYDIYEYTKYLNVLHYYIKEN